ncbi:MAG: HD domain-containing protein [Oligoflexia bacterium]|nr:HD domain-containing protein [Oligoflexia bacterium]
MSKNTLKKAQQSASRAQNRPRSAPETLDRIQGLEREIAGVLQAMQEKVQQFEYMSDFSALLNSSLDTSLVREKALEATCKLLRCETASLFLVDRKKAELYWETALGDTGKELQRSVRLPIDNRSIAGYVAMSGESVIVNDIANDPRHFKKNKVADGASDSAPKFETRNMVCVPLRARGQTIGVLQALNKLPLFRGEKGTRALFHDDDRKLLESLSHQVAIAVENSRLYENLKQSFFDTVEALAEAIEKKDRYTGGHTKRVVHFSLCIAKYLKLTPEQVEQIRLGALLHDVGKIGIEDKILKKQAPLEGPEWDVMQTHPTLGFEIMSRVEGLKDVIGGMRFHHERWDGKGYPLGLKGDEIPLIARVIAVADAYDAMVSTRPYRKGMDPQMAYDEIVKNRDTQFDPVVVDAFIQAFQNEKMGRGSGKLASNPTNLSNCD